MKTFDQNIMIYIIVKFQPIRLGSILHKISARSLILQR